jgi:flagellar hook-associated protein 3 FlgL
MRVDPSYVSNLVSALNQTQAGAQQLTSQLSSGMRITSLSDDPLASGQNVLLLSQMAAGRFLHAILELGHRPIAGC